MASSRIMDFGLLHKTNLYNNIAQEFMTCILKSGLLLDEHNEALLHFWKEPPDEPRGIMHILSVMPHGIILSASILKCLSGERNALASLGLLIPAALHGLFLTVKKMEENKYKDAFKKLVATFCKLYRLIKAVDRHYQSHVSSIRNLNQHTTRMLFQMVAPKIDKFLQGVGKDIIDIMVKLNELMTEVHNALCLDDRKSLYDVPINLVEFNLPTPPQENNLKAYYDRCSLSYVYFASSFLCEVGLGFCCPREPNVMPDRERFLDVLLPQVLDVMCTGYEKIAEEFERAYGNLPGPLVDEEGDTTELAVKLKPIDKLLDDFIANIRTVFDVAQIMQVELRQTDYINIGYILDGHCDQTMQVFSDCQDMLNSLKRYVCRQIMTEHAAVARRHELRQFPVETTIQERNINESGAGTSVIRHDDPDVAARAEEYNLSVHGSDEDEGEEDRGAELPSAFEYGELLNCVKRQKLMIQELNVELRKRKLITQEGDLPLFDHNTQNKFQLPMAAVLPSVQRPRRRTHARAAARNYSDDDDDDDDDYDAPNMNGPPPDLVVVPQQHGPLPPGTTFQQMFPQPNFPQLGNLPYVPDPPPALQPFMPYNFNDPGVQAQQVPYEQYENLAAQIHAAVANNRWAGNEEVYEDGPEIYETEQQPAYGVLSSDEE